MSLLWTGRQPETPMPWREPHDESTPKMWPVLYLLTLAAVPFLTLGALWILNRCIDLVMAAVNGGRP